MMLVRLVFYIKNIYWNYNFWLFSKPVYRNVTIQIKDAFGIVKEEKKVLRFKGYLYKGNLYYDNPGRTVSKQEWKALKKRELI